MQRFIEGSLWHDAESDLSAEENNQLWWQLGVFAKRIHSYSGTKGQKFGYPSPFKGFALWSDFIDDNVKGMVADCHRLGVFCEEIDTYCTLLPHFHNLLNEVKTPKLLHGDLWPRNVLFNGTGKDIHLAAVFDAERAFWGDPICDWVLILYGLPETFWQGYGENLLEVSHPIRVAIYRGMYFILNILETTRFQEDIDPFKNHLREINQQLQKFS